MNAGDVMSAVLESGNRVRFTAAGDSMHPFIRSGQVRALGVAECVSIVFQDHHRFTETDVARIVRAAAHADVVVCTLKDAVKLTPLWPRAALPLWYVSQRAEVERGEQLLSATLATVMSARASLSSTAGVAG